MSGTLLTGEEEALLPSPRQNAVSPGSRPGSWPGGRFERPVTREQRATRGRGLRSEVPRSSHAEWNPPPDRTDPVDRLTADSIGRIPELVPLRNGRMLRSAFSFFRGSASLMAADLVSTPSSGIAVQLCGDAHLSNFGGYASPERHLVFDLNDFDETIPGPWEWDLKRLATSLEVAGRDRGFDDHERRTVVQTACAAYRYAMHEFAEMSTLQVWYSRVSADDVRDRWGGQAGPKALRKFDRQIEKAMTRDSARAAGRLTELVEDRARMVSDPPLIVPVGDLLAREDLGRFEQIISTTLRGYRRTLPAGVRHLVEQYRYGDVARKVVGVGSVGTRTFALLMTGLDQEPLMLQLKEAGDSALAPYAGKSRFRNQGQRVVVGQQLLQASSDVFLGWTRSLAMDGLQHDFYVRQLWDWKLSADVETQSPATMAIYGQVCAWTLARGHARSGDRCAIAAYLGQGDVFDLAVGDFARAYSEQNEADYAALMQAAGDGRIVVAREG